MVIVDDGRKKPTILSITQTTLQRRYDLVRSLYISERFEISPNITERSWRTNYLHISHAPRDASVLSLVEESFLRAYRHAKEWFGFQQDIVFDLWLAPDVADMQYMTCLPCDDGFFCAPGSRNGMKIILFVSPRTYLKNSETRHLTGCLAHEITHHVVREMSMATDLTMKRRENRELPMWLEEGLCQLMQGELDASFRQRLEKQIAGTATWYDPDELWNDLSACRDMNRAYAQAYRDTRALAGMKGRQEIIRLLRYNRKC